MRKQYKTIWDESQQKQRLKEKMMLLEVDQGHLGYLEPWQNNHWEMESQERVMHWVGPRGIEELHLLCEVDGETGDTFVFISQVPTSLTPVPPIDWIWTRRSVRKGV